MTYYPGRSFCVEKTDLPSGRSVFSTSLVKVVGVLDTTVVEIRGADERKVGSVGTIAVKGVFAGDDEVHLAAFDSVPLIIPHLRDIDIEVTEIPAAGFYAGRIVKAGIQKTVIEDLGIFHGIYDLGELILGVIFFCIAHHIRVAAAGEADRKHGHSQRQDR